MRARALAQSAGCRQPLMHPYNGSQETFGPVLATIYGRGMVLLLSVVLVNQRASHGSLGSILLTEQQGKAKSEYERAHHYFSRSV